MDSLISKLDIIASLKHGQHLDIDTMTIKDNSSWFSWIYYEENSVEVVKKIGNLFNHAKIIISDSTNKRYLLDKLILAIRGFISLKITYQNNNKTLEEIDIILRDMKVFVDKIKFDIKQSIIPNEYIETKENNLYVNHPPTGYEGDFNESVKKITKTREEKLRYREYQHNLLILQNLLRKK